MARTRPPEPVRQGPVSGRKAKARPEEQRRHRHGHRSCAHQEKPPRPWRQPTRDPPPRQRRPHTSVGGGRRLQVPALRVQTQQRLKAVGHLLLRHVLAWGPQREKAAVSSRSGLRTTGSVAASLWIRKGMIPRFPFPKTQRQPTGGSPMSLSHTLPYVACNRDRPRGPALGCGGRNRPETDPGRRPPLFSHSLTPAPPSDHDGTVTHRESRLDRLT